MGRKEGFGDVGFWRVECKEVGGKLRGYSVTKGKGKGFWEGVVNCFSFIVENLSIMKIEK